MSGVVATDVFTPELLAKLGKWSAPMFQGVRPEKIAVALRAAGIGLVDLDRQRFTIDERVYESALHRLRLAEQRAAEAEAQLAAFIAPAVTEFIPATPTRQELPREPE